MMKILNKLAFLFVIVSFISCEKESGITAPLPGNTVDTIYKDLTYGSEKNQNFDLYLPAGRTDTTPVIILIHGGGWSTGDKNELSFFGKDFQKKGFAVANINYRLSPQSDDNYNMQLDDVAAVINLLQNKSGKYIYSKDRFYTMGHSAGAHLALSYAYTRNTSGVIKAAAGMGSPTNLFNLAYYNTVVYGDMLTAYLGVPLTGATAERYKDASPVFQVTSASVPTILFHGDLDFYVNKDQSQALIGKLNELKVSDTLIIYPLTFHDWWTNGDFVNNTVSQATEWFMKYH